MATTGILKLQGGTGKELVEYNSDSDLDWLILKSSEYLMTQGYGLANNSYMAINAWTGPVIGTFQDFSYDDSAGTLGDSAGSFSSIITSTDLYQRDPPGAASLFPVGFRESDGSIVEYTSSELESYLAPRIGDIFANDYPNTFKLSTTSPGSDYSQYITNLFTDTRSDGTIIEYHLWKRDTYTSSLASAYPLKISKSGGFDGLREMTDADISSSMARAIANQIDPNTKTIGSYILSSTPPTDPGTWVEKGTATDTRNIVVETDYTRNSTLDFTIDSTNIFTTTYTGNYLADYEGGTFLDSFIAQFEGNFSDFYIANYDGPTLGYLATFSENYVALDVTFAIVRQPSDPLFPGSQTEYANFQLGFNSTFTSPSYTATYIGDFLGNFTTTYVGDFTGNYVRGYTGNYVRGYTGNYVRNYTGNYLRTYLGTGTYIRNYGGSARGYARANAINWGRTFTRTSARDFTRVSNRDFTRVSNRDFTRVRQTSYIGPEFTRISTNTFENLLGGNYGGNQYAADYIGDFIGNYDGVYYLDSYVNEFTNTYITNSTVEYISEYVANYVKENLEDYVGDYTGNYIGNYIGDFIGNYTSAEITLSTEDVTIYKLYVRTA